MYTSVANELAFVEGRKPLREPPKTKFGVSPAPVNPDIPPPRLSHIHAHLLLQGYHITSPSGYSCAQASDVLVVTGVFECIQQVAEGFSFLALTQFFLGFIFLKSLFLCQILDVMNNMFTLHTRRWDLCRILWIPQSIAKAINIYLTAPSGYLPDPPLMNSGSWWRGGERPKTKLSLSSHWVTPQ